MLTVRKVQQEDFSLWLKLRKALWPESTLKELNEEILDIFSKINENPVFLAYHDHDIAGFIECSIHQEAPGCKTNKIAYIEGWFVYPNYRNLGIGRQLMEAVFNWAKDLGINEIASDTTDDYPLSPKAHKQLGFIETIPLHYMKRL